MYKCGNCGEDCDIYEVSEFSNHEFWGYKDNRTEVFLLSNCCSDNIMTDEQTDIRYRYRWEDAFEENTYWEDHND